MIVGQQINRLTVLAALPADGHGRRVLIKCACGTGPWSAHWLAVETGKTKSCGCLRRERTIARSTKHGLAPRSSRLPEYGVWKEMHRRCSDKNRKQYKDYGGRGIRVCEEWTDFAAFLRDMGPRPSAQHSIERRDNERGYEPSNCYWATRFEQNANRRFNRLIQIEDYTFIVRDIEKLLGIGRSGISQRMNRTGESAGEAVAHFYARRWAA